MTTTTTTNIINNGVSSFSLNNNSNIPTIHSPSNPIVDCIRDGTMAYIYLVDESYIQQQHQPNPKFPSLIPLPKKIYSTTPNKTTPYPFQFQQNNENLSIVKEIYNYINCFEIKDCRDFHCVDSIKRYARFHLNLTLKFMGCKSIHARQISNTVFEQLEKCRIEQNKQLTGTNNNAIVTTEQSNTTTTNTNTATTTQPPIYCVSIQRNIFYYIIGHILSCYQYSKPQYIIDFPVSCEVQDKKHSFTILLGGTSGCGKSTLTALLASRIGFTAVISTDNIRQLLRKFISRQESPILWASTYHAGEIISNPSLSHKEKILQGYEAQNEMIFNKLDILIGHYEKRKESLIVEGVHLDTKLILRLVKKHPSCIPFLMYISNEAKHKERFAIRSKYMTLDPHQNKYTKYFKNIRIINDHLCHGADEHMIPQIDNTSIDRSLATIHGTIFACLKRKVQCGESYYNHETDKMNMLYNQYEQIQHQFWSSKGMLRLIQKKKTVSPHGNNNVIGDVDNNNNNSNSNNNNVNNNNNSDNNGDSYVDNNSNDNDNNNNNSNNISNINNDNNNDSDNSNVDNNNSNNNNNNDNNDNSVNSNNNVNSNNGNEGSNNCNVVNGNNSNSDILIKVEYNKNNNNISSNDNEYKNSNDNHCNIKNENENSDINGCINNNNNNNIISYNNNIKNTTDNTTDNHNYTTINGNNENDCKNNNNIKTIPNEEQQQPQQQTPPPQQSQQQPQQSQQQPQQQQKQKQQIQEEQQNLNNNNKSIEDDEEAFNSDDEHDHEDDSIRGNESGSVGDHGNSVKKSSLNDKNHNNGNNQSNEDNDDDSDISDSDSDGGERIDYYLDCGSLGS
ncbi:hypothetical protein ACTFIR_009498 [Dictyostelium discoideum]